MKEWKKLSTSQKLNKRVIKKVNLKEVAQAIADGKIVGWFQGKSESGHRALGNRSILADPRNPNIKDIINKEIKLREDFRPFAPSVLEEESSNWFDLSVPSPYMLIVAEVNKGKQLANLEKDELFGIDKLNKVRSLIPAVTHVDYSARVQTVNKKTNPDYHMLINEFFNRTGCPIIVNTSFNVRGEPIVCTPEDAFKCFMGTELDLLVIGNCVLRKEQQDKSLTDDYKEKYELD